MESGQYRARAVWAQEQEGRMQPFSLPRGKETRLVLQIKMLRALTPGRPVYFWGWGGDK